ncbi:MAG: pilus assembly protein PilM [Syntrophotaleaceae bacterium]
MTASAYLPGSLEAQAAGLQQWLSENNLVGSRSVFALAPDFYQLLQIAPPEVPNDELRDAVRWQIRDLIDFPLEEAVVDVFQVPRDVQREGARTAYVVVARQSLLRKKVALLKNAKLKVQAIDIPELVLRNIVNLLPNAHREWRCFILDRIPAR